MDNGWSILFCLIGMLFIAVTGAFGIHYLIVPEMSEVAAAVCAMQLSLAFFF